MLRIVDERLGNFDVLSKARNQVDIALSVTIDRGPQFEMLSDGLLKVFAQVRVFGQHRIKVLAGKGEEHARGRRTDRHVRWLVRYEVGLAEEFAFCKQCDAKVTTVNTFAEDLD